MAAGKQSVPTIQDLDDSYQISIMIAFLTGFGMILSFVICEDAPCHSTPAHETGYLLMVALLMSVVTCCAYYLVWESLAMSDRVGDIVVLFVYLMQFFVTTSRSSMKPFVGVQPIIQRKDFEYLARSIIMVMKDVDRPLDLFPTMSSSLETPPIVRNMMPLFMLLLVVRLSLHPTGLLRPVTAGVLYVGVFLITLSWMLSLYKYVCFTRGRRRKLLSLIWQMLDENAAKYILPALHCPRLLRQIHSTKDIGDFCAKAVLQLDPSGKAGLVDALAKNGLGWGLPGRNKKRQKMLLDILMSAEGQQLTQLKNHLDMGGSVFNLVYIFEHLTRANQEIFQQHVDEQCQEVGKTQRCKILSDIDDTLHSSGGHFPAGSDRTWPRGWFYPGVLAFYRNLDRYHLSPNFVIQRLALLKRLSCKQSAASRSLQPACHCKPPALGEEIALAYPINFGLSYADIKSAARQTAFASNSCKANSAVLVKLHRVDECNLVFLSARPHVHKDVSEQASYRVFQRLVHERRLHIMPSLIPGSLWPGLQALLCAKCCRRAWRAAALKKFNSFMTYARLYPEYEFIWIGDNGQGDVFAAELMMHAGVRAGVRIKACFIHAVVPLQKTFTSLKNPTEEAWAARKIFFFKTYIGAALAALDAGLLNAGNLAEVVNESLQDYYMACQVQMRTGTGSQKRRRIRPESLEVSEVTWQELCADVERANEVLQKNGMPMIKVDSCPYDPTLARGENGLDGDEEGSEEGDDCELLHSVCPPGKEDEFPSGQDLEAQLECSAEPVSQIPAVLCPRSQNHVESPSKESNAALEEISTKIEVATAASSKLKEQVANLEQELAGLAKSQAEILSQRTIS